MQGKVISPSPFVGLLTGAATIETSMENSRRTTHDSCTGPSYTLPHHTPTGLDISSRNTCLTMFVVAHRNSQDMEPT